jgi:hypothetical protein
MNKKIILFMNKKALSYFSVVHADMQLLIKGKENDELDFE